MSEELNWVDASIAELSAVQLHHLLKLRVDVFVVEQRCAYAELDGLDALPTTRHVFATDAGAHVVAAARILAADAALGEKAAVRIGRVVVAKPYRGTGLAQQLMERVLACCQVHYPNSTLELSAQVGVDGLYAAYGFEVVSEDYLEDGIAHRDMRLIP